MSRRLARVVIVRDAQQNAVAFGPTDDVPDWAAAQITNPRAWEGGEPPGLQQLARVGATAEEITVILELWDAMPEEDRFDSDPDPISDREAREQLEDARAAAAEKGLTFVQAMREAIDSIGAVQVQPDPLTPPPPAVEVTEPPKVEVETPARNASKAAWVAYATSQGMPEEDAQAKSRDDLADLFGT